MVSKYLTEIVEIAITWQGQMMVQVGQLLGRRLCRSDQLGHAVASATSSSLLRRALIQIVSFEGRLMTE